MTTGKKIKFPKIVSSLDSLKILLFWEIVKKSNPYLLDLDYTEDKEYTKEESKYIAEVWDSMYDRFFVLTNNQKAAQILRTNHKILLIAAEMSLVQNGINMLKWIAKNKGIIPLDTLAELEQRSYNILKTTYVTAAHNNAKINPLETPEHNILMAERYLGALNNKLNIEKSFIKEPVEQEIGNIYKTVVAVSRLVDQRLDVRDMVVTEWLEWEKAAKDKHAALLQEQQNKKFSRHGK